MITAEDEEEEEVRAILPMSKVENRMERKRTIFRIEELQSFNLFLRKTVEDSGGGGGGAVARAITGVEFLPGKNVAGIGRMPATLGSTFKSRQSDW